ncbi:hypothetical protein [Kitasatospora sp. NPDC096140]|uniref:hypothetical protein n=1 Tax=Kitasatospora sp. NPDC096140 TaxID=3155425 RepID=UPI00332598D3
MELRLPEPAGNPVLTGGDGRAVVAAAVPGDERRFRVRLTAGGVYRLSRPGPAVGH